LPGGVRAAVLLAVLLLLSGCSGGGPVTAVPSAPTPKNLGTVAVIRLGGPSEEPAEKDVVDGLKEEGLIAGTSFQLAFKDAGGDAGKLPGLVEEAAKASPAVLITLSPDAAKVAASRAGAISLVSATGAIPPESLGLGKAGGDALKSTGAYSSLGRSNLVSMACACFLPERRKLGIVFDPGDPASVAVKDSLLKADLDLMSVAPSFELAEARTPADIPAAVQDLIKRKAALLLLVPGKAIDDRAVIDAATRAKLPVFGYTEAQAQAGAALVRVPSSRWSGFEAGRLAARVLKDVDPRALPIKEGSVFLTIANQAACDRIGFKIRGNFLTTAKILK
jgi:ABC-type uncharacterized transport system substrate-binding protein